MFQVSRRPPILSLHRARHLLVSHCMDKPPPRFVLPLSGQVPYLTNHLAGEAHLPAAEEEDEGGEEGEDKHEVVYSGQQQQK